MKNILILLLFFIVKVNAQFNEKTLVYGSFEIQAGNYFGFNANINYIHNNKYSFKLGYTGLSRNDNDTPSDFEYNSGIFSSHDRLGNYYLLVGKIYQIKVTPKKSIRANMAFGFGYLLIREPINYKLSGGGWFSNSNYTWDYNRIDTFSFVVNPKVEFLLNGAIGVSFSPLIQLSKKRSYFGAGAGLFFRLIKKR